MRKDPFPSLRSGSCLAEGAQSTARALYFACCLQGTIAWSGAHRCRLRRVANIKSFAADCSARGRTPPW
jgi:hypothetical protein